MSENIVIQIREDGSRVVVRNIREIGNTARSAQSDVTGLRSALLGLASALALNEVKQWMDIWTRARGQVNIFTHSLAETNAVMEELYQVAQRTRQPIDGVVNSFHQLSIAGSALGASQRQLIDFTENIGMALAIQGTNANTARGGIIQLGQAMNEGIVRAQEYNSMINSMPIVLKAVANNLDGVDGSLAKLRKRMLEGKLYSRDFFEALLKGGPQIREMFDRSGKTIESAFTIMRNAMIRYVGNVDQAYQISQKFFAAAVWGSQNIDVLVKSLTALAAPLIINRILALGRAIAMLGTIILANPLGALLAAIAAAITAITLFRDEITLLADEGVTLGDYMRATWSYIVIGAKAAYDYLSGEFADVWRLVVDDWNASIPMIIAFFDSLYANVNNMIGTFVGLGKAIGLALEAGLNPLKDAFISTFNWIIGKGQDLVNTLIGAMNSTLPDSAQIELVNFPKLENEYAGSASKLGTEIKNAFTEALDTDWIGDVLAKGSSALDALTAKAKEQSKARKAANGPGGADFSLDGLMGEGEDFAGSGKPDKALQKLRRELIQLMNQVAPAEGAVLALAKAQDTLRKSVVAGYITQEQSNRYWELAKAHYEDIIKPLNKYNKDLDDQFALLGKTVDQREIEAAMIKARRELMEKGASVDEAELGRLRERLQLYQELNKQQQAQDQLLAESVEKRKDELTNLQAITALLNKKDSGFTKSDATDALVSAYPELFQGTQQYVQSVVNEYQRMFDQIAEMRSLDLIDQQTADQMRIQTAEAMKQAIIAAEVEAANARLSLGTGDWADASLSILGQLTEGFTTMAAGATEAVGSMLNSFVDGFADAVASSIMNGESLADALGNIARQVIQQLLASLIKLGIQWALNAALSQALSTTMMTTSLGMAAATATAWAPAAALVSLATFGGNSGPAMTGIALTNGLTQSMAMAGFKDGGYTGSMGVNQVAGLVHGQEYVSTASATARYRPYLEAMNEGTFDPYMGGDQRQSGFSGMQINIENNGTPQNYEVASITEDQVRLIATDVADRQITKNAGKAVGRDLTNPNSEVSKSMGRNTQVKRRRTA